MCPAAAQYVAPSRLQLLAGQGLEPALDRVSSQVAMTSPAWKSERLYRPAAADEWKAEITVAGCICNCTRARICISAAVDFRIVRPWTGDEATLSQSGSGVPKQRMYVVRLDRQSGHAPGWAHSRVGIR